MAPSTHAGRRFDRPVASSVIRERVLISARSSGSGRTSSMASPRSAPAGGASTSTPYGPISTVTPGVSATSGLGRPLTSIVAAPTTPRRMAPSDW